MNRSRKAWWDAIAQKRDALVLLLNYAQAEDVAAADAVGVAGPRRERRGESMVASSEDTTAPRPPLQERGAVL